MWNQESWKVSPELSCLGKGWRKEECENPRAEAADADSQVQEAANKSDGC